MRLRIERAQRLLSETGHTGRRHRVRPWLRQPGTSHAASLYGFWGSLTEALRTGAPQNEAKHGGDLFGTLYADPARLEGFLRAMTGLSLPVAEALADAFPWRDVDTVVDIGTAQGCVPVELARRHPHLGGGGFDLPLSSSRSSLATSHRMAFRTGLRFIPGDFFVDDLPRADVLVMGHILHDWDLPTKRMLIGKAYAALKKRRLTDHP